MERGKEKLFPANVAARRLDKSDRQVRRLYRQGKLPGRRLSERGLRFTEADLETFRQTLEENS